MVRRARYYLHYSMRAVNLVVNACGVAMIIYSLWLLKKWQLGVSDLPAELNLPKPWFIHACLGVGIGVCLSTIFGHIVANSINLSTLFCIYILAICLLLFLEITVVVTIFYRIDWTAEFSKLIDEHHTEFESFVIFNINVCRLVVIIALVPQIYVIVLAIILSVIGTELRSTQDIPDFRHSFLVGPNSPMPGISGQISYRNLLLINISNNSLGQNPGQRFLPYIIGFFRARFPLRARGIAG